VGLTIGETVLIGAKVAEKSTEPLKMDETENRLVAVLDTVRVGVFEYVSFGVFERVGVDVRETDLEAE
jgi:hypothetical protein